jgi:hypothetical protein
MLMAICAVSPKCRAWLPVLIDDPALPDAARERVLADHPTITPDASISATSTSKARPPSLIGWPSPTIPKRRNPTIGRGRRERITGDDCRRYFRRKSQIFELAPASGAPYVVNAANLAAGGRAANTRASRTGFRSLWLGRSNRTGDYDVITQCYLLQ